MTPTDLIDEPSQAPDTTDGELGGVVWKAAGRWTVASRVPASTTSSAIATVAAGALMLSIATRRPSTEGWKMSPSTLEAKLMPAEANLKRGPRHPTQLAFARLIAGGSPSTGEVDAFVEVSGLLHQAVETLPMGALLDALRDVATCDDEDVRFRTLEWLASSASDHMIPKLLARHVEDGNIADAYTFAALIAERNPRSAAARRWVEVLRPPTFHQQPGPPPRSEEASISSNTAWMNTHSSAYEGQWVALLDGVLLGHAQRLEDLRASLDIPAEALVTRLVP